VAAGALPPFLDPFEEAVLFWAELIGSRLLRRPALLGVAAAVAAGGAVCFAGVDTGPSKRLPNTGPGDNGVFPPAPPPPVAAAPLELEIDANSLTSTPAASSAATTCAAPHSAAAYRGGGAVGGLLNVLFWADHVW